MTESRELAQKLYSKVKHKKWISEEFLYNAIIYRKFIISGRRKCQKEPSLLALANRPCICYIQPKHKFIRYNTSVITSLF